MCRSCPEPSIATADGGEAQSTGYGYAQHPDRYATTWRRFFASIIDSLILGIGFGFLGAIALSRVDTDYPFALYGFVNAVVFAIYSIFGHGLWGGTPGKLMLGLRVVTNDENEGPIGHRAFTRAVPQAAFALVSTAILFQVNVGAFEEFLVEVPRSRAGDSGTIQDPDGRVYEVNEEAIEELVVPALLAGAVSTVGFWAYVAPLAFTRPRRSLGDLAAGTRLVRKEFEFVSGPRPGTGGGYGDGPPRPPVAQEPAPPSTYRSPTWEDVAGPRDQTPQRPKDPPGW